MELKLAIPSPGAAASIKPLNYRFHLLHSRFCSFVSSIFFLLWISSLLLYHSSSLRFRRPDPSSIAATDHDEGAFHDTVTGPPFNLNLRSQHDQGAPRATSSTMRAAHQSHTAQHMYDLPSVLSPSLRLQDFALHSSLPSMMKPPASSSTVPNASLATTKTESPTQAPSSTSPSSHLTHLPNKFLSSDRSSDRSCDGKYIFMYSLPPMFNQDMISNCTHHSPEWADFCILTSNGGLGPILQDEDGMFTPPEEGVYSWYSTDQFILDVIFHSRMKRYGCLTQNSSSADLIYVPFYAGLDITKHLWRAKVSEKEYLPNVLASWLTEQPEWQLMQGRDHFFVTGKISWDFRRTANADPGWGNSLLELPALKDVSVLLIEKGPAWASHVEHAIPYPTYFHPHKDSEIFNWQDRMRSRDRVNLFAFAGASRPEFKHSIRGDLIEQCRISAFCKLLECHRGKSGCNSPATVMKLFQESVFCLQPVGDSFTRRSVFDAMVSGCIPVLFHPRTIYTEYTWHFPSNISTYSVFIPEQDIRAKTAVIEHILQMIPASQIKEMREKVIDLLPALIYAHPDNKLEKVKDAFDVALEALFKEVSTFKREKKLATQDS